MKKTNKENLSPKKKLKADIDSIISSYKELNDILDQAHSLGVIDYEGKLHEAIWGAFENLLDILEERLDTDLISSYIWNWGIGEETELTTEDIAKAILNKKKK